MAIPSGEIYLLRNVPLTNTYEHTIDFKNSNEQFTYFHSFVKHTIQKFTYIRREREYISVELPLADLEDVNYLIFRSVSGERLYYAFVEDKIYSSPGASQIFYTIDVMQTFQFDYKWNASYIRQAHVDRWTAEHKPIYSKTEEGLDYGTEYSIESAFKIEQSDSVRWLLVTFKDYDAILDSGYSTDVSYTYPAPSAFVAALVPIDIKTADQYLGVYTVFKASTAGVTIEGAEGEEINIASYPQLIKAMLASGLGDYIISVSLLTYNPFITATSYKSATVPIVRCTLNGGASYGIANFKMNVTSGATAPVLILREAPAALFSNVLARADWNIGLTDTLPTAAEWDEIKANPYTTKRDKRWESKLLCAPYRYNLLTDWRNAPIILKNEYMTADKIEIKYSLATSHNAPMRFWVTDYKKDPEGRYTSLSQPMAPEFPIISDAYSSYILQNKNTIQANMTNAMINAGAGVISGAISGAATGGVAGGIAGAAGALANGAINVGALIRSENAKQLDLRAVPDGVINNNDSAFNINDKSDIINFYRMRICCENELIISEIFNMTGYKVNRVEVPNTRSRTRFNYIQTAGANITGSISQQYLTQLKEIFNNGVTIWHYHAEHFKMLDYSYENIEVNLI